MKLKEFECMSAASKTEYEVKDSKNMDRTIDQFILDYAADNEKFNDGYWKREKYMDAEVRLIDVNVNGSLYVLLSV